MRDTLRADGDGGSLHGATIIELLTDRTGFLPRKGEAKPCLRQASGALKEGSIAVHKEKVDEQ